MARRKTIPPAATNDPDWFQGGMQCTATSKRTKQRCRAIAAYGTNVCMRHGAKAAVMNAQPEAPQRTAGGRYARMPKGLLERFERLQSDPNLLSLRKEVVLVDALLEEALEKIDAGANRRLWGDAKRYFSRFEVAMIGGDDRQMREAFALLKETIALGDSDALARQRVDDLIERRRKVVESERRAYAEMKAMVTADDMITMVQKFADIAKSHIKDEDTLTAIGYDMERALTTGRGYIDA